MGTNNYYKKNASAYFTFCDYYSGEISECCLKDVEESLDEAGEDVKTCSKCGKVLNEDQCYYRDVDSDYEDFKDYLEETVREECEKRKIRFWPENGRGYRSDDGRDLFSIDLCTPNGKFSASLTAIVRHGYYIGANLDWELSYTVDDSSDILELDWIEWDLRNLYGNEGLAKINAPKVMKSLDNTGQKLVEFIEEIYTRLTKPLVCVARFSNGEAMYQKLETTEQ